MRLSLSLFHPPYPRLLIGFSFSPFVLCFSSPFYWLITRLIRILTQANPLRSLLLRRRAKARNVSKVKYYFFTVLQFSIYLSFYLLYTDAAYTSLLASFHLYFRYYCDHVKNAEHQDPQQTTPKGNGKLSISFS